MKCASTVATLQVVDSSPLQIYFYCLLVLTESVLTVKKQIHAYRSLRPATRLVEKKKCEANEREPPDSNSLARN